MEKIILSIMALVLLAGPIFADHRRLKVRRKNTVELGVVFEFKRIEFDADYFFGNDGFYFVDYRQSQINDLQNQAEEILRKIEKNEQNPVIIIPEPPVDTNNNSDDNSAQVYQIFSNKCASCHVEPKPKAGLVLLDKDRKTLSDFDEEERENIYRLCLGEDLGEFERRMPLGAPKMSAEELEILKKWVDNAR